jgi:hypothetical protein
MRSTTLALAALAGLAVSAFAAPAGAFTPTSSAGIRDAAQAVDPVVSVHCRSFKHRSYNHPWGFGCRGGAHVSVHVREGGRFHRRGFEEREGVRSRTSVGVRERSSTRSETNVRSNERSSTRGEVKGGTSGSSKSSTTGRSGTTGNKTETGVGGTSGGGGGTGGTQSGGKQ